jgi:hypothetical protein
VDQIPLPEIIVVLAISLLVVGTRTLFGMGSRRLRGVPAASGAGKRTPAGTQQMRARLIASCVLFAILSLPLIFEVVPPNGIYGFRNALTRSSESIWYPANAFAGWALLIASAAGAGLLFVLPAGARRWLVWTSFLGPVLVAVAASLAYLQRFK